MDGVDEWMSGWMATYQSGHVDADGPRGNREVRGNGANHAITPIYAKCGSRTHTYTPHPIHIATTKYASLAVFIFIFRHFSSFFDGGRSRAGLVFVVCRYLACTYVGTYICMYAHTDTHTQVHTHTHGDWQPTDSQRCFVRARGSPELCDRVRLLLGLP